MKRTTNGILIDKGGWAEEILRDEYLGSAWIVDTLFSSGLNTLSGAPKEGKTNLAVQVSLETVTGALALCKLNTWQGGVLYISLEEYRDLVHERLMRMIDQYTIPPRSLRFEFGWRPIERGGVQILANYLAANPGIRLVVIDVFQRFRGNRAKSSYSGSYAEISSLQKLGNSADVAIVVLHHVTKKIPTKNWQAALFGSYGLPALADTNVLLTRPDFDDNGVLRVAGRKGPSREWALKFNPEKLTWVISGEYRAHNLSDERIQVISALKYGPLSPQKIANTTGLSNKSVYNMLQKLWRDGLIEKNKRADYHLTRTGYTWLK